MNLTNILKSNHHQLSEIMRKVEERKQLANKVKSS